MGPKPQYIVRLTAATDTAPATYYKDGVRWKGVPRAEATQMTHKEANRLSVYMPRLGYSQCVMEPA